jgi:DNA-binding transcriptional LysR family regulator
LEERLGGELLELLGNEQIDVAFIRTPHSKQEQFAINRLLEEPMLVALPASHALARNGGGGESALLLKDLARETFILYAPLGTGLREVMMAACRAAGFSPRVGQEAPRVTSTLSLVAVGLGISLVPASLSHLYLDGVVYRRLRGAIQPKAPIDLASRRGDPSMVVRHFLKLVRKAAKDFRPDESVRHGRRIR